LKLGGGSVKIWTAKSWYIVGPVITMNGRITNSKYVDTLGNQVHPMVQMLFLNNDAFSQDDNSPIHIARSVQSWFEEYEDTFQHHPWPTQLPELNIIELLWSVSESKVRSRIPPPSSFKQLQYVLHHLYINVCIWPDGRS
jgi:hypothetical protein